MLLIYFRENYDRSKEDNYTVEYNYKTLSFQILTAASNIEHVLEAASCSSCTTTYHPSRKLSQSDEADMQDTFGEVETSS